VPEDAGPGSCPTALLRATSRRLLAQRSEDPELGAPGPQWTSPNRLRQTLARLGLSHVFSDFRRAAAPLGAGAAVAEHTAGRWARCPRCQSIFAICHDCDRGHVYCGRTCAGLARRDSLRRARRRHRQSFEGRLDHRDRERARRQRRREALRVGDHPSGAPPPSARLPASSSEVSSHVPIASHSPHRGGTTLHCVACQQPLRFTQPEPAPPSGVVSIAP